jgi:hypothetical protein
MTPENKALLEAYPQYYKDVSHLEVIDVYRILELYGVTDPTAQHSLKKLLLSGQRTGGKTAEKDLKEARDTLSRGLEMRKEDTNKGFNQLSQAMIESLSVGSSLSRGAAPVAPAPAAYGPAPVSGLGMCSITGCQDFTKPGSRLCHQHFEDQPWIMSQVPVPVPPLPVKTEDKNDLPVEKPAPMPYTAPTAPTPAPPGPVAAPATPKL